MSKTDRDKKNKIARIIRPSSPYTHVNNALCFLEGDRTPQKTAGDSLLGRIQDGLKRFGGMYYFLLRVFSPVILTREFKDHLRHILDQYDQDAVLLNFGSGPQAFANRRDIINIDLYAFDTVDIVGDVRDVPLEDNSVDVVINIAVLEHIAQPEQVVRETYRVLRPGGICICYVPFMVPFHAAPHDYYRWTLPGAELLFQDFRVTHSGAGAGPTSGLLYVLQEWIAITLSFGNSKLHDLIFLGCMLLTSPCKLFDRLIEKHPKADVLASGFYVLAQK